MTKEEMVGWHHQLNGHEFKHIMGESEGPGIQQFMGSPKFRHDLATEPQLNNRMILKLSKGWWNKRF